MYVTDVIDESYRVAWADLCFMKENILETLLTSLVGPLLYLLAFGYGIGGSMGGGQAYVVFIIPGIIALNTLSSTFSTVSMRVFVQKRFYFSFDEMLLCPIHVSSVVLGKSLYGVVRALISCSILLVVGKLIAPEVAITPWIFVIILASSFTFSLMGLLVGMKVKKTNSISLISGTLIVPMTFLCGTLFDVSALPSWAGAAVYALPLTHVSALTRAVSLGGEVPLDSVAIIVAYMAVFFFVCWYLIKTNRCRSRGVRIRMRMPFSSANAFSMFSTCLARSAAVMPAVSTSALSMIDLMSSTESMFTAEQKNTRLLPSS